MEFWEFLIQKEGDRSWLPLESPSVEILEGKYRIVARSSRSNTATEVRVTHYATEAMPPVRRVRKRSSQTNPEGLIVILPFTRLQPGLWELHCTGDVMSEMMGENWQYAMQLEVLSEAVEDWEPDWEPDSSEPNSMPISVMAASESTAQLESDSAHLEFAQADTGIADINGVAGSEPSPGLEPIAERQLAEKQAAEVQASLEETTTPDSPDSSIAQIEPDSNGHAAHAAENAANSSDREFSLSDPALTESMPESAGSAPESAPADQVLAEAFQEDFPDAAERLTDPVAAQNQVDLPTLQVVLDREIFVIQRAEPLTLTGRIDFPPDYTGDWQPAISELRVRLYDPQTSQLLMDEVYPIDHRIPPFPFSGTISLPAHYQTYLVLGELIFQGTTPAGDLQVLATRSFNVTTDLHELIESLANDFPDVEAPPEAALPEPEPLPRAELNRLRQSPGFQRSQQQPLPPQLYPSQPHPQTPTRTHATLDLPSFTPVYAIPKPTDLGAEQNLEQDSEQDSEHPAEQESEISTSAADLLLQQPQNTGTAQPAATELAEPESDQPALALDHDLTHQAAALTETPEQPPEQSPEQSGEDADLFLNWSELDSHVPTWRRSSVRPVDLSNKPEDVSFRALNFQNRFWNRLQELATSPEISAEIGKMEAAYPLQGPANGEVNQSSPLSRNLSGRSPSLDAELTAHEIVVDDIGEPVPAQPEPEFPVVETDLLSESILPADEPIPTPRLQLPTGEMIAGKPLLLTVKLPNLIARVYVKLWLRDRQTRALLGTPRWLIDFVPDGFGNQMARAEVIVPPGSLKVQFEAIAVEIATQRESDKVTTTRPIVPPDMSPLSLDRLEI